MLGRATRLARYVTPMDKSYTTTARFGYTSDTLDAEGEPVPVEGPVPDADAIRARLPEFTGSILQVPPMASAIKVGGRRLYDLHRQGVEVEREPRPVEIHAFTLVSADPEGGTATFEISCSSGTYVRSLISDLANHLETGAYLTALRRTRVGNLTIEDAHTPSDLSPEAIHNHIILSNRVVEHLPVVAVDPARIRSVCAGQRIEVSVCGVFRVESAGELLAVYRGEGGLARPEVVLCGE